MVLIDTDETYTVIKVATWKRVRSTSCYTRALSSASYNAATIYDSEGVFVETYEEE
jgi:hypothetical protein